jgi:hypothetical protein
MDRKKDENLNSSADFSIGAFELSKLKGGSDREGEQQS